MRNKVIGGAVGGTIGFIIGVIIVDALYPEYYEPGMDPDEFGYFDPAKNQDETVIKRRVVLAKPDDGDRRAHV